MFTVNFCARAHASASIAACEDFVNVVVSAIVGFEELLEARYGGGEAGAPSSSLNGTAMARMGVEDEAEVALWVCTTQRHDKRLEPQYQNRGTGDEPVARRRVLSEEITHS